MYPSVSERISYVYCTAYLCTAVVHNFSICPDAFRSVDLNVTVTSEIARQLHQLWMDTLKQRMSKEEEEMLEMVADSHESQFQLSFQDFGLLWQIYG